MHVKQNVVSVCVSEGEDEDLVPLQPAHSRPDFQQQQETHHQPWTEDGEWFPACRTTFHGSLLSEVFFTGT